MSDPNVALAVRERTAPSPYEPSTYESAKALAKDFASTKLFKATSAEQVLLIMATGRELGIPPTTALRMIYIADFGQGPQVTLSADLMVALCLRSPVCEYFRCVESTDERATYATKRKGDPERRHTFTVADKERARLGVVREGKDPGASNWAKYPAVMLRHRAASILAREVYPDVIGGFYTEDEAREISTADLPAPVEPLPEAKPSAVVDAVFTEVDDEQRVIRLFDGATSAAAVAEIAKEALAIWPSGRPAPVRAAYAGARARTAPRERQIGEEG